MASRDYLKKYDVNTSYNLKFLWSNLKSYKFYLFILIFLIFLTELITFGENFFFKFLIDKAELFATGEVSAEQFIIFITSISLIYFVVVVLGGSFLRFLRPHFLNKLESSVMSNLEKSAFAHILKQSFSYHIGKKTGGMISQFTRGVNKTERLMDIFYFNVINTVFRILFSISVFLYFDLTSGIILFITLVLFVISGITITNAQKKAQNEANYKEDLLKQNISDVFTNFSTVKFFGKEDQTISYFSKLSHKLKDARVKMWNYFRVYSSVQTFIINTGFLAILYFSFMNYIKGDLSLGSVTLIYAALWKLNPAIFGLMHGYMNFVKANVDVSALYETFKSQSEVTDHPNAKKLKVTNGGIVYDNVCFGYGNKKKNESVLKNFNLHIKGNTKVALVGPSGSGKTTIINLLYRMFDLHSGNISIDGQDISEVTQKSLRNSMSIVPQEPILFDNTIYFNIAYANSNASSEDVWRAIKFAQLDKMIRKLPKGVKTIVGERGIKLSGGEKQRVSIARALLADKKILILDEATSALDSETEKEIQRDLARLMVDRTTIIIAHRLSTIMSADIIVVLDEGDIKEIGTHNQLKRKGGLYRRLWELQQSGRL